MKKIINKPIFLNVKKHFSVTQNAINIVKFDVSISDIDTNFSFFKSKKQSINLGRILNTSYLYFDHNVLQFELLNQNKKILLTMKGVEHEI